MAAELDSQPKSVQSIYTWYSENRLHVNRRYQRKLVWTTEEKQRLVESILKRYPVPAIILAEKGAGDYEIIDGLQRLHTIVSFIETAFPTLDGKFFDVEQFPTARTRSDEGEFEIKSPASAKLAPREVSAFLDYSMAISVMRGATEQEIDDVFSRINTYGHRLSDQERRQAGVQDAFSQLVRDLACQIRGDASSNVLPLSLMPSISIDLPMTKQGYDVVADEVFWVNQGILRSTDLRDSMDEQCIADIAASIVGGQILERSKEQLDNVYEAGHAENERIDAALAAYGPERFAAELKFCVDEILKIGDVGSPSRKLRDIIFTKKTSNQFPSAFAVLVIALHELLIVEGKKISNYSGVQKALEGLYDRIDTSRKSTAPDERRKNVDTIKGLISSHLVAGDHATIYGAHSTMDIDSALRRSEIELPHYELKQGRLRLDAKRLPDSNVIDKIIKTACAMANNGKHATGTILIGVTDDAADASKIAGLDGIAPRKVGSRHVVGVAREAKILGISPEDYYGQWKTAIKKLGALRSPEVSPPVEHGLQRLLRPWCYLSQHTAPDGDVLR